VSSALHASGPLDARVTEPSLGPRASGNFRIRAATSGFGANSATMWPMFSPEDVTNGQPDKADEHVRFDAMFRCRSNPPPRVRLRCQACRCGPSPLR
jgi:hypothetical protein